MSLPQRFYPTSGGSHPSGGSWAQLFNYGVRRSGPEKARRPPVVPGGRLSMRFPLRSSAAPCQLPPPHPPPPPPQDDELPPQDDELLPQECPPELWPEEESEDEESDDDPLSPPDTSPPAPATTHQLASLEPELEPEPERALPPEPRRPPDRTGPRAPARRALRLASTPTATTTATTARMMPMTMASPSFQFPRSGPPWAPRVVREPGMPAARDGQSRVEQLLRVLPAERPLPRAQLQVGGRA